MTLSDLLKRPYVRDIQTDTFTHRSIIDRCSLRHIRANSEESFHAGADLDLFNREMEIIEDIGRVREKN